MATFQIADGIVPEIFAPYVQQETKEKSNLIKSGAIVESQVMSADLAGGASVLNTPSFTALDTVDENVSTDEDSGVNDATPQKTSTGLETYPKLNRNQVWSSTDLAAQLIGADPMQSIANQLSTYWAIRMQKAFIATMQGVFADNAAAPVGTEHTQDDMTNDLSALNGAAFSDGVTNFGAEAFLDAAITMGDSSEDLTLVMVHSTVLNTMRKKNLIVDIPDARGEVNIPTYQGKIVIQDDAMPRNGGVFESWLFGRGAVQYGSAIPANAIETDRKPSAGNGGGLDTLHSRVIWGLAPKGCAYVGTPSQGGPSNAATSNNLANADSWRRVYTQRKQIPMARLITREF